MGCQKAQKDQDILFKGGIGHFLGFILPVQKSKSNSLQPQYGLGIET